MQTEQNIKVYETKDEITLENRICTLEQEEVYVKAAESFMEEMTVLFTGQIKRKTGEAGKIYKVLDNTMKVIYLYSMVS